METKTPQEILADLLEKAEELKIILDMRLLNHEEGKKARELSSEVGRMAAQLEASIGGIIPAGDISPIRVVGH